MHFIVHPEAEVDIFNGAVYYESEQIGLGIAFLNAIASAKASISYMPGAWIEVGRGIRKFVMKEFPYSIFYRVNKEQIFIIAVAHQKRRPGYWENRIQDN